MSKEKWLVLYSEKGLTKRTRVKSKEYAINEMNTLLSKKPLLMTKWDYEKTYGQIDMPKRQSVISKSLEIVQSNDIIDSSVDLQKVVQQEG